MDQASLSTPLNQPQPISEQPDWKHIADLPADVRNLALQKFSLDVLIWGYNSGHAPLVQTMSSVPFWRMILEAEHYIMPEDNVTSWLEMWVGTPDANQMLLHMRDGTVEPFSHVIKVLLENHSNVDCLTQTVTNNKEIEDLREAYKVMHSKYQLVLPKLKQAKETMDNISWLTKFKQMRREQLKHTGPSTYFGHFPLDHTKTNDYLFIRTNLSLLHLKNSSMTYDTFIETIKKYNYPLAFGESELVSCDTLCYRLQLLRHHLKTYDIIYTGTLVPYMIWIDEKQTMYLHQLGGLRLPAFAFSLFVKHNVKDKNDLDRLNMRILGIEIENKTLDVTTQGKNRAYQHTQDGHTIWLRKHKVHHHKSSESD